RLEGRAAVAAAGQPRQASARAVDSVDVRPWEADQRGDRARGRRHGYFVEKNVEEAKGFMDRKVAFLQQNTESLKDVLENKRTNLEAVIQVMQLKMRLAEQQGKKWQPPIPQLQLTGLCTVQQEDCGPKGMPKSYIVYEFRLWQHAHMEY
ncbi:hypothetical protein AaE_003759, partial [Aphanomyces astaci]